MLSHGPLRRLTQTHVVSTMHTARYMTRSLPYVRLRALTPPQPAPRAPRHLAGTTFDGRLWSTIRGVGPVLSNPVMAAGEEDILESNAPKQGCVFVGCITTLIPLNRIVWK